jgi:hypothetical protein
MFSNSSMRKLTISGCWLGSAGSVVWTVWSGYWLSQGVVVESENHQRQPANSALGLVVSAVGVFVFAASLYKFHSNPKWNGWANSKGIYQYQKWQEKGDRLPRPR